MGDGEDAAGAPAAGVSVDAGVAMDITEAEVAATGVKRRLRQSASAHELRVFRIKDGSWPQQIGMAAGA